MRRGKHNDRNDRKDADCCNELVIPMVFVRCTFVLIVHAQRCEPGLHQHRVTARRSSVAMEDSAQQNRTPKDRSTRQHFAAHERLMLAALMSAASFCIRVVEAIEHGRK